MEYAPLRMRVVIAALFATLAFSGVARAEAPPGDGVRETASSEEAKSHFEAALVHYRAGRYRSAIVELEKAYGVDPTGKDLVYNLAVVYEKLGELDSAIHYLERYVALEPDPDEVKHANAAIERLRGARSELKQQREAAPEEPCPEPAASEATHSGRFDGWVALTGGVSLVSAIVGAFFGLRALDTQPGADDATGPGESREQMRQRSMDAKHLARIADVAFAVSFVSGSAAAVLYFGRSTPPESGPTERSRQRASTMTVGISGRF